MKSQSLWTSMSHAASGVAYALRSQRNMKIHLTATVLVIAAGLFFGLSGLEWTLITLTITAVWATEILNSSLEEMVDMISPQFDIRAGRAKNMGAGAVLVTALGAVVVGIVVFGPRILRWLGGLTW